VTTHTYRHVRKDLTNFRKLHSDNHMLCVLIHRSYQQLQAIYGHWIVHLSELLFWKMYFYILSPEENVTK